MNNDLLTELKKTKNELSDILRNQITININERIRVFKLLFELE